MPTQPSRHLEQTRCQADLTEERDSTFTPVLFVPMMNRTERAYYGMSDDV
jgi:hypothetical protein